MGFPIPFFGQDIIAAGISPVCEKCRRSIQITVTAPRPPPLNLAQIPDSDDYASVIARIQGIIARAEQRFPALLSHRMSMDFDSDGFGTGGI